MKGVPTHIIQKTKCLSKPPIAGEKHIQSSRLSAHANTHTTEVATTIFLDSIFKRDPRINLARPAVDGTMTPDVSTILHAYITPHPSSIPCSTMPSRLSANNVIDELHKHPPTSSSCSDDRGNYTMLPFFDFAVVTTAFGFLFPMRRFADAAGALEGSSLPSPLSVFHRHWALSPFVALNMFKEAITKKNAQ
jgi:hypothetical protein